MSDDMIALSRRAVACKGWRWMPGAATDSKFARIVATDAEACRALGVPREGSVGSWGHATEAEALVAALESAP